MTSAAGTVNNGDTVTVRQTSSSSSLTTTIATLTIGNVSGTFSVTTMVNTPPKAMCKNVTVPTQSGLCEANASIDNGSYDPDGDPITLVQSLVGPYRLGDTTVTLTVTDSTGASDSCTATVTVVDQEAQVIGAVSASPKVFLNPNLKMVAVTVSASSADNCSATPVCRITSVTSNESVDGLGGGD